MELFHRQLMPTPQANARLLEACNTKTAVYGLTLSAVDLSELQAARAKSLAATGRVEFGEGILEKLASVFCNSPFLDQSNYSETLAELQDLFYSFKKECRERAPDDELLSAMKRIYDGPAHGSLLYLADIDPDLMVQMISAESLSPLQGDLGAKEEESSDE